MKINSALALTSAVFLTAWVAGFVSVIFHFIPVTIPDPAIRYLPAYDLLFIAIIELLSIISVSGSVFFLLEARKILARWYLAAPLCISLALLVIANLLICFNGNTLLEGPISTSETLWLVLLALLSPCSLLLFLTSYGQDSLTELYIVVTSATSIFSAIFLFSVLKGLSSPGSVQSIMLPLAFYLNILLPATGICYLSKATMYGVTDNEDEDGGGDKDY